MVNLKSRSFLKIGLGAASLSLGACTAQIGGGVDIQGLGDGSVTLDWTVDGSKDEGACADYGVEQVQVSVSDSEGEIANTVSSCEDFAVTIALPEGDYSVDATMLDHNAEPVSTTLSLDNVRVVEDTDQVVEVDFPADSFY